ncbi:hypothetical protein C4D60_Mb06t24320 [Musa balbisiana]|uniref:Cupin type-1 domain-containing protein n=1 Tax=Musa balbisiana TaxID=52838 RepID=A0A4V4H454_MUSBA|nr:hypothetical protein C4D60_Mb06t24320 [Musa balbisiana]
MSSSPLRSSTTRSPPLPPNNHELSAQQSLHFSLSRSVDFVTSNPDNKLVAKVLHEGDVMCLCSHEFNYSTKKAVALSCLSSQNAGVITIANSVFGSKPAISDNILAKAFQMDKKTIDRIQAHF